MRHSLYAYSPRPFAILHQQPLALGLFNGNLGGQGDTRTMGIPLQVVQKRTRVRIRTVVLVMYLGAQAVGEARPSSPPGEQTKQANNDSARRAEAPAERAWRILHEGLPAGELRPTGQGGARIRFARGQCGGGKGGGLRIARRKTECAVGGSHGARFDARGARRNLEEALGTANRALCWPR